MIDYFKPGNVIPIRKFKHIFLPRNTHILNRSKSLIQGIGMKNARISYLEII